MTRFHPWRFLRDRHPDVHVHCDRHLRRPSLGVWDGRQVIHLDTRLEQAGRRCTLTHELVHMCRGAGPTDPAGREREERIVDELAARLLITLDDLVDALRWGQGSADPDDLWVDLPTLQTRIRTLTDVERAHIEEALRG